MTDKRHKYAIKLDWTGNTGTGTSTYRGYERRHEISAEGKPAIPGSSDAAFRGDAGRWNPEELLVAALAACHKLSYLHLCADAGVVVTGYRDAAEGVMVQSGEGGRFERVVLRPVVTIAPGSDPVLARALHERAHANCFIASSVNFPVTHEPTVVAEG